MEYITHLYDKYVVQTNQNKYGKRQMHLPAPHLVVFYNGVDKQPEEKFLKLSDSFPKVTKPDIEVTVRMLNINSGKNRELMGRCKPLAEYAWLVAKVRENNITKSETGADSATGRAIDAMPDDFVIKPFLVAHRAEVKGMLLTEYREDEVMELFKEEGREEERISSIRSVMANLKTTAERAMDILGIPASERARYAAML